MAKRQHKIRWRDSDTAKLQRAINNFNAKLYRIKKKNPDIAQYLPDRVNKTNIINSIGTRADYNRTINSLKRFSQRGAEKVVKSKRGAKMTQWEAKEYKIKEAVVNRERNKQLRELKAIEVKSRGKGQGETRARMGSIKENSLKPVKRNLDNMSQKEWDIAKVNINRALDESFKAFRKSNMRMNYIKGLQEAGFSVDIIDLVRSVDIDKFIETVETDQEAMFDFIYDPIEHELKRQSLEEVWRNALESQQK